MLFNNLYKFSENKAILTESNYITYGDIIDFSKRIKKKTPKRSLVFSLCRNEEGSVLGYISFILNGVVPLLLDASIEKNSLESLKKIYKPNFLWVPNDIINKFNYEDIVFAESGYSLLKIDEQTLHVLNKSLALLLTTSGSTGSPKLVRLSYENLHENSKSISNYLSIDKSEKPITLMSMNYSFGLSIINSHLINGSTILLTSKSVMQREFWNFLKKYKATSISGVPYIFEMLIKLKFFRMSLPSLKTITQAGGKLNNNILNQFAVYCKKSKIKFYVMYGQTEASPRMSYLSPKNLLYKMGSIGLPIPDGKFYLIDSFKKKIIINDTVGELVFKGKNVCHGYAKSLLDLKKENENKNILHTGDLAKRDNDGFYYIVGRKKRFVKLFGNRLSLDHIENLIKNITINCACVDLNNKVLIYLTENNLSKKVINYISSITKIHHSAFEIKIIKKIPLNSNGKINYSKL
jgi:long-chain acyl-CoA synthetase